jgi:alpha-amylase
MRKLAKFFSYLLAGALLAGCTDTAPVEETLRDRPHRSNAGLDWRDQIIYQVLVDRFENGDPSNDINVEPNIPARYHGGDWQGLIDRMDYIEELGITALWISPVVRNVEEDAGFASYHGYWAQDLIRTNPHFGDIMTLRRLVDEAHSRDIMDIVTNHMGQLFYYDINGNGRPDDTLLGGGTHHTCIQRCGNPLASDLGVDGCNRSACSEDECVYCVNGYSYFERITEWDPEYDPRGIQGWSSLGFSGDAAIRFLYMPEINRTPPPMPPQWWLDEYDWNPDRGWFDRPDWYNRRGRVYTWWHEGDGYSDDFIREQETLGDFPGGLKDLDTDNPIVREALIRVFQYWIDVADFDGLRIDTLKHIDRPEIDPNVRGFWGEFTTRMREHAARRGKQNFFMFGEAFDGNDELLGAYTFGGRDGDGDFGRVDSVFYFSQKYRVINPIFQNGGPTNAVEQLFSDRAVNYPDTPHASPERGGIGLSPQQTLVGFLDNHDLERFLFHDDATPEMLRNALFYLLTWDGIPCIYYGTEQEFEGGNDPMNREDMWLGNPHRGFEPFDTSHRTYRFTRDMIDLRREHVSLRRGEVAIRWTTSTPSNQARRDAGILAFERIHDDETALVVINASDDFESETCAPNDEGGACMETSFPAGTTLRDVAPGGEGYSVTVAADGTVNVSVPPRGGRVLLR